MIHDELSDSLAKALHVTDTMEQGLRRPLGQAERGDQGEACLGRSLKIAVVIFREWAGREEVEEAVASSSRADTGCPGRVSALLCRPASMR